jgi:hypothetical protein
MGTIDVMSTSTHLSSGRQLDLLLEAEACELSGKVQPCTGSAGRRTAVNRAGRAAGARIHRRDRVTVDLRGLRARLETRAAQHQVTTATLVRRAVVLMLDDGDVGDAELDDIKPNAGKVKKLTLRVCPVHAAALASRARAADVSQGRYVCTLLDGMPAPPQPTNHSTAVTALRASSDKVAAMSVDLNAFLRLLRLGPNKQMENYRAGLMSLAADMRAHLATASVLIADLAPSRAKR